MKRTLLLLVALECLLAQTSNVPQFTAHYTDSSPSANDAFVLMQTTSATKRKILIGWVASCSSACTISPEVNGTGASQTAVTPTEINGATAEALVYRNANIGAGTALTPRDVSAGTTWSEDLRGLQWPPGVARSFALKVSAGAGTVRRQFVWQETP